MPRRSLCILLLMVAVPTLSAKQKPVIPAVITNANYVYVTTYSGDVFSPNITPSDRAAVNNVQNAIQQWGRYKLVLRRGEADLILVVRTGRVAEAGIGIQSGGNNRGPGASGRSFGGQVGDPQDRLDIYDASTGTDAVPLWTDRAPNGLQSPGMQLMHDLRAQVEAATKKKP